MTLSEFKAWFDGFSEIMDGTPNEKQWERIKARVSEINGQATPYPVFVDRYVDPYRRYWPNTPYWASYSASNGLVGGAVSGKSYDSNSAMLELGKAEYSSILNS